MSALPLLTESDLRSVGNGFGLALLNQSSKSINSNPNMDELLADTPTDAKDLIKALLVMDPTKRLTAKQAMCHKYVEKYKKKKSSRLIDFCGTNANKKITFNSIGFAIVDSNWS